MATTWVNEGNGEQYFIQRHDHVDRIIVLTWGFGDQDTTTVWTDLEAADLSLRSTPISCLASGRSPRGIRSDGRVVRAVARSGEDRREHGIGSLQFKIGS